jgi:hypothetical protein
LVFLKKKKWELKILFYAFIQLFDQVASIEVCGRASVNFFYVFGAVGKFDLVLEFQILKSRKYNNVN